MSSYDIVETSEQDYLYAIGKTSMAPAEISRAMGEAFQEVWNFMQAKSIPAAGSALAVYYDYSEDEMEFRAGFFIAPEHAGKAEGAVMADKTPATRAVHALHTGPYSTLQEIYSKIMGEMKWNGHHYGKPTWELYLNDPDVVPEAELKTEIFIALA
jgi:AraC family transcriptional regulator